MTFDERKKIPTECPACDKTFSNVFSMSAHKGHCLGKSSTDQLETGRGWNKDKILSDHYNNPNATNGTLKRALILDGLIDESCSQCGLVLWFDKELPLELDHIDGNHKNEDASNLQTLCANCHRLKTYLEKDYLNK